MKVKTSVTFLSGHLSIIVSAIFFLGVHATSAQMEKGPKGEPPHNSIESPSTGRASHLLSMFKDSVRKVKPLSVLQRTSDPQILGPDDWNQGTNTFQSSNVVFYSSGGTAVWSNRTFCAPTCVKKAEVRVSFHAGGSLRTYEAQSTSNTYTWNAVCTLKVLGHYRNTSLPDETLWGPEIVTINQDTPELLYVKDITQNAPLPSISSSCGGGDEFASLELIAVPPAKVSNDLAWKSTAPNQYSKLRIELQYNEEYKVNAFGLNQTSPNFYSGCIARLPDVTTTLHISGQDCDPVKEVTSNGGLVRLRWFDDTEMPCKDSFPSYQIQVLRLYNMKDESQYNEKRIWTVIDWSKALTIETHSNIPEYSLMLTEGRGYYVWRVRPIGNFFSGGSTNPANWGPWCFAVNAKPEGQIIDPRSNSSMTDLNYMMTYDNQDAFFFYDGLDEDKNWVYSRNFMEGSAQGVTSAESITYVDGLLKEKQTQSRVASKDSVLVSESIYDYTGRQTIKTLLAPVGQKGFLHRESIVTNSAGGLFTQDQIDNSSSFLSSKYGQPEGISSSGSTSLISKYYSNSNTASLSVPNADGYPFSSSRVGADGRLRETGGIGWDLRIGGGKTTKIYYSGVATQELTSVFGDEAPDANSVFKQITIDPESVITAQYVSKEGKIIATCLLGDAGLSATLQTSPNGKTIIGSAGSGALKYPVGDTVNNPTISDDLNNKNRRSSLDREAVIEKPYCFAKPTTVTLTYDLTPNTFSVEGAAPNCGTYCATCDVIAIIRVVEVETQSTIFEQTVDRNQLPDVLRACNSSVTSTHLTWTVNIPNQGTYSIQRILKSKNDKVQTLPPASNSWSEFHENMCLGENLTNGWDRNSNATPNFATLPEQELERCIFKIDEIENEIYAHLPNVDPNPATQRSLEELNNPNRRAQLMMEKYNSWFDCTHKDHTFYLSNNTPCSNITENTCRPIVIHELICNTAKEYTECGCSHENLDFEKYLYQQIHPGMPDVPTVNLDDYFVDKSGMAKRFDLVWVLQPGTSVYVPTPVPAYPDNFGWFNSLVLNMRNEQCSIYTCKKLWSAWVKVVGAYKVALDQTQRNNTVAKYAKINVGSSEIFLDLYEMFLDEIGRFGCVSSQNLADYKTQSYSDFLTRGYKKIYRPGPFELNYPLECLSYYNNSTVAGIRERLQSFDLCVRNKLMSSQQSSTGLKMCIPPDPVCLDEFYAGLTKMGDDRCKERKDTYKQKFIAFAAATWNLYPAGTKRSNGTTIQEMDNDCLKSIRIECAVNNMFLDCQQKVTITSQSSASEIDEFKKVLEGTPDLALKDANLNACPIGFRDITSGNPNGGLKLMDAMANYLNDQWKEKYNHQNSMVPPQPWGEEVDFGVLACNFLANNGVSNPPSCLCNNPQLRFVVPRGPLGTFPNFHIKDPRRDGSGTGCCGLIFTRENICGTTSSPFQYVVDLNSYLNSVWGLSLKTRHVARYQNTDGFECTNTTLPNLLPKVCSGPNYVEYKTSGSRSISHPIYEHAYLMDQEIKNTMNCDGFGVFSYHPDYVLAISTDLRVARRKVSFGTECDNEVPMFYGTSRCFSTEYQLSEVGYDRLCIYHPSYTDNATPPHTLDGNPSFTQYWQSLQANQYNAYSRAFLGLVNLNLFKRLFSNSSDEDEIIRVYGPIFIILPKLHSSDPSSLFFVELSRGDMSGSSMVNASLKHYAGTFNITGSNNYSNGPMTDYFRLRANAEKVTVNFYNTPNKFDNLVNGSYVQKIGYFGENPDGYLTYYDIVSGKGTRYDYERFYESETIELDCPSLPCPNVIVCDNLCIRYTIPPDNEPEVPTITYVKYPEDCSTITLASALTDIQNQYHNLKAGLIKAVDVAYNDNCSAIKDWNDNLNISYSAEYYHYTLYYHDRSGNVTRTVPPRGVNIDPQRTRTIPQQGTGSNQWQHWLSTHYQFNSFGNVICERSPDGGEIWFGYNKYGQLRLTQTSAQRVAGLCSYQNYDEVGRIIESGQCNLTTTNFNSFQAYVINKTYELAPDIAVGMQKTEIIRTIYGYSTSIVLPDPYGPNGVAPQVQRNLRNKVNCIIYDADGVANSADESTTYYSYDNEGNVEWMIQQSPGLSGIKIEYEYDVTSGSVNMLKYRSGFTDQYFRKYEYDRDGRLCSTYSSSDSLLWDKDATYEHYIHGPLQRTVVGEDSLQGTDYTYTIQGWLKSINHSVAVNGTSSSEYQKDPGRDGINLGNNTSPKTTVAKDIFSSTLSYYNGDYTRKIANIQSPFNSQSEKNGQSYTLNSDHLIGNNLYSGNISACTIRSQNTGTGLYEDGEITGDIYQYDQLNRIIKSDYRYRNGTNWVNIDNRYNTSYSYDANGNVLSLTRSAFPTSNTTELDNLTYDYGVPSLIGLNGNKVQGIVDNASSTSYAAATGDLGRTNIAVPMTYQYDQDGNLTNDANEGISIQWNHYGRIKSSIRSEPGKTTSIYYVYDAAMNRVGKDIYVQYGSGLTSNWSTRYIYDVKKQLLAVYTASNVGNSIGEYHLNTCPLYGEHRIGEKIFSTVGTEQVVHSSTSQSSYNIATGVTVYRRVGMKNYELNDHLGSVRAVFADVKRLDGNGSFIAELRSVRNYYPYGMQQPGRSWTINNYEYGFNGKQSESDVKGEGNYIDYGSRAFDPRVIRWYSRDPASAKFASWSPYNYGLDNPIYSIDPDGLAPTPYDKHHLGSVDYYIFRYRDFIKQNPGKTPPEYYLNYGLKYALRFTNVTFKTLSREGKIWLINARRLLQQAIEERLDENQNKDASKFEAAENGMALTRFAFDSHPDAYWKAGLYKLQTLDLVKILLTPDAADLTSKEGIKQVAAIGAKFVDYFIGHPEVAIKRAKEAWRDRELIRKLIEEKAQKEGVPVDRLKAAIAPIMPFLIIEPPNGQPKSN